MVSEDRIGRIVALVEVFDKDILQGTKYYSVDGVELLSTQDILKRLSRDGLVRVEG